MGLSRRGNWACISAHEGRIRPIAHDPVLYRQRHRIEAKMWCLKLLGKRLSARTPSRQIAELQIRAALLNRFTALGRPETKRVVKSQ